MAQSQKTENPTISEHNCQWQQEWYHSNRWTLKHHLGL